MRFEWAPARQLHLIRNWVRRNLPDPISQIPEEHMRSKCLSVLALTTALATGFCGAASAAALLTSHVPSAVAGHGAALAACRPVHADAHAGRPADAQQGAA